VTIDLALLQRQQSLLRARIALDHAKLRAEDLVEQVKRDVDRAPVSEKLKALLHIAGKVAESGRSVAAADVERARQHGATDLEIHDTVLIAAVFCLCNRYVDGLATWTPSDPAFYRERAKVIVDNGYSLATTRS
jgi:alkylhydroperoxidase family enzyme